MKAMKQGCIKTLSLLLTVVMALSAVTGAPVSAADLGTGATRDQKVGLSPAGVGREVTYLDENGDEQTVQAQPFDRGAETIVGGWYYVDGYVNVTHDVRLSDTVNLILCDNAQLDMNRDGAHFDLGRYGYTDGTALNIYRAPGENEGVIKAWVIQAETVDLVGGQVELYFDLDAVDFYMRGGSLNTRSVKTNGDLTVTGGTVDVDDSGWSIACEGNLSVSGGILRTNVNDTAVNLTGNLTVTGGTVDIGGDISGNNNSTDVTISGGSVSADGEIHGKDFTISGGAVSAGSLHCNSAVISGGNVDVSGEFYSYTDITLGWRKFSDSIKAEAYGGADHIIFADGQQMTDGTTVYSGTYNFIPDIGGRTLTPYSDLSAWQKLQYMFDHADNGDVIELESDTTADFYNDTHLVVPAGKNITLDLKGCTLDRNSILLMGDGNVITNNGTLTIIDTSAGQTGTITGGYTGNPGGGIVNNGTLTIEGGTITGNRAHYAGGIANGTGRNRTAELTINGGAVDGNTSIGEGGAGIVNYGVMTMNGGAVTNNTVVNSYYNGGGIWTDHLLTVTGGSVTGNTAGSGGNGGGIYYYRGTLNLSGSPVITGNTASGRDNDLYFYGSGTVTIADDLSVNARIGVCKEDAYLSAAFTSGLSGRGDASNFISDHSGYAVRRDTDGEAVLRTAYTVTVNTAEHGSVTADASYACEGDTVTLTVTPDEGCCVKKVTVNNQDIMPVNGVYSFTMPADDVTVSAVFSENDYTITYLSAAHGTVSGPLSAKAGERVELSVAADDGYVLRSLTVVPYYGNTFTTDANYRFTMPAYNVSVMPEFAQIKAYAAFDSDSGTLTFRYDTEMPSSNAWELPTANAKPGWRNSAVTHVVFDESFRGYQPASTAYWFYHLVNLESIVGWDNLDTSETTSMKGMFYQCEKLTELDLSGFDTSQVTDMSYMFYICEILEDIDMSGWDVSGVTDMSYMFGSCRGLTSIDLNGWDTSSLTDITEMFYYCDNLTALDLSGFDTSQVTDMTGVFVYCKKLTSIDLSGFDTSRVTEMWNMFYDCESLSSLNLESFNTSRVTNMRSMFENCKSLTSLDLSGYDTSAATDMRSMFDYCTSLTSLDLSGFDTSSVTDMRYMFFNCTSLTSLDLSGFDTSAVTDMRSMFDSCSSLTALDLSDFDTAAVADMEFMFRQCSSLETITVGGGWSTDSVTVSFNMFYGCNELAGGRGTEYNTAFIDKAYAHPDGGVSDPGYLTGKLYTITWKDWDGSTIDTTQVAAGDMPTHADHSRESDDNYIYTFDGWEPELAPVTGDTVYTATYSQTLKNYRYDKDTKELTLLWGDFSAWQKWGSDFSEAEVLSVTANNGVRFVDDCVLMFYGFTSCESIDLSNVDTSGMTNTAMMFKNCSLLTSIDLSGVDTSGVTDMQYMFDSCGSLTAIDLSGFNTSQVTNMSRMFDNCKKLTSLDLSSFDTSSVTDMSYMFRFCEELTTIRVGDSWTTESVTASNEMFLQCAALRGGNGTVYRSQNSNDKTYARIDGGTDAPGYFTAAYTTYTVTWKNYDGSILKTDLNVREGAVPEYTGTTPVRGSDGSYTYTFSGWSPKVAPVRADVTYTATYTKSAEISYIDENGATQTVTATVITGEETSLDGGWYAVTEDAEATERLTFNETANLILCDGATLTLRYMPSDPMSVIAQDLNIFAQENGSGKIAFTADDDDDWQLLLADDLNLYGGQILSEETNGIILANSDLTVYGGSVKDVALAAMDTVTVNGGDVDITSTFDYAIASLNGVAVNGGTMYAKGAQDGIYVTDGVIELSWTDTTDSVHAESYGSPVELKKAFITADDLQFDPGAVEDNTAINNITLYASHDHSYGAPVWTWADDNSSAAAAFTCAICGHVEEVSADASVELINHQCQQPGNNRYTVSVTFNGQTYTDEKTVHVDAAAHTYDGGRTLLKTHCMRDGLTRYTCTLCGSKRDERIPCRGSHDWTQRTISYEEYQEQVEDQSSSHTHSVHSHFDLAGTGSSSDNTYILKECKDCDTKLVEAPDGNKYVRFGEDEWADDASTVASESDLEELASTMASEMAGEVTALGADAGIVLTEEYAADIAAGLFAVVVGAFASSGIRLSKDDRQDNNECVHVKNRVQTKDPTCTEKGEYKVVCYKCGRVFNQGDIEPLGHSWGSWVLTSIDEDALEATETRTCTRCQKKEERKRKLAVADLMIQYSDNGSGYVNDSYSVDGTGAHCKCTVSFADYQNLLSGSVTHAVDYENAADNFSFYATAQNGYDFVGWYYSDGTEITDQSLASRPKVGRNVYYARFKKRTLDIEYKLYDDSDKSGGSQQSGKLKVEVNGKTYEKSFAEGQAKCSVSIDHEYLTDSAELRVTLTMDPKDKCAFIKDVRTDYKGVTVRGEKNKKISKDDDDDIHVMKKTEHSYTLSMSELLDEGRLGVTKVQYATDLEKGIKIAVDKTDTNKFPGCSAKIRYKLNGEDKWKTATDGVTLIYHSGDKFAISAVTGDGKEFDGWRENLKIITREKDYQSTVYADAVYTPIFRYTTIRANYVDIFGNFIATKAIGEEPPTPYSYANYEFTGWDKEPTEITQDGEKITAQYKKLQHKVTVTAEGCEIKGTVDGEEKTAADTLAVDYDAYVTVKKSGTAYWTLNDKTVCYGDSYTFLAETDITLVAHQTTPGEEKPLVEIISVKKISDTDYRLEFIATRFVPENCQFIQAGFVCGKDLTDEDLNLDNVGKQGSNPGSGTVKVGYCESTENNAEFSMTYGIKDQNAPAMAKAFISYIDENGEVKILYSGMVTFNYQ